jgi:serine protease Do
LPQKTAIAQQEVAGPGLPVFDREGRFIGIGASSFGQTFLEFSNADRGGMPIMLVNVEESSAFITAEEVLPYLGRIPHSVYGRPLAWLGTFGIEPMDREVASFLKLGSRSGAVISEILEGSPADKAGLKARDIIVGIDGKPLPRFMPERIVVDYIERQLAARVPGQVITLSVLRGVSPMDVKVVLGDEPKMVREARRKYFERLGFSAREFVYSDAVVRHSKLTELDGLVANFVKPNGPADLGGLRPDDWIKEIDGAEISSFQAAVDRLEAIEKDPLRNEVVLLVTRGGDTSVLRIKLR